MSPLPQPRPYSEPHAAEAKTRLDALAKPPGSLGKIEAVAAWWCGATGRCPPLAPTRPRAYVFAGDHGVTAQGVSPYPSAVTALMIQNFLGGGAAINQFAAHYGVQLVVVNVGVAADLGDLGDTAYAHFLDRRIAPGTADFTQGPAMSRADAEAAVRVGIACAEDAAGEGVDVLAAGEMGIGNTTSAAAILSAIACVPGKLSAGRGTGVDDAGLARKIRVIDQGIALHQPRRDDGFGVLSAVGGFEIAAIAGLCVGGAALGIPVVIDGFISTAGALVASVLSPGCVQNLMVSHRSAENGHWAMSRYLQREPIHDLDMRLGEGVGAVMAIDTIRLAVRVLNGMAVL